MICLVSAVSILSLLSLEVLLYQRICFRIALSYISLASTKDQRFSKHNVGNRKQTKQMP